MSEGRGALDDDTNDDFTGASQIPKQPVYRDR